MAELKDVVKKNGQDSKDHKTQNNCKNEDLGARPLRRRTHFSDEHSAFLKSLPLINKLQANKAIDERNSARKSKALENRIKGTVEPESDCESCITIEDTEASILLDEDARRMYLPHLGPKIIEWIFSQKKRDSAPKVNTKKRGSDDGPDKQHEYAKRRYISGDDITPYVWGEVSKIVFPAIMSHTYEVVDIPLPIFTTKNLLWMNANLGVLPVRWAVNQGEKNGVQIIDVAKFCEERNCKELTLSCSEWVDAARNMSDFHCQLDVNGVDGKHAKWYARHFSFFNNLRSREDTYEAWKKIDLEIRQSFKTEKKEYSFTYYQSKLEHEITRIKILADFEATFSSFTGNTSQAQGSNKARNGRNGGNARSSSSKSFLHTRNVHRFS